MRTIRRAIYPALILLVTALIVAIIMLFCREQSLTLQGTVECREYRAASKISGRIESIYCTEGERVDSGAMLFSLTTPELNTKLQQALSAHNAALALEREVDVGARPQQIEAARNLWQRATAAKELAQSSYNRIQNLHNRGVVTSQQLDEARANLEAATASQSAAFAEYNLALSGATSEQKAAAKAKASMAQGAVNEVEAYINDSRVYAPVSGEISTIAHFAGEIVGAGFPVVTLLDLDDIWVEFNIAETLLPHFNIGSRIRAYIPAIDNHISLIVSYIAPQADFAVQSATRNNGGFDIRTFVVKMQPEKSTKLRPGMSAIVKLQQ